MPAVERVMVRADQRAKRLIDELGRELRAARLNRSLNQRTVAEAAAISQAQLSMLERGLYHPVSIDTACRVAAMLGLDLALRTFPSGEPIRDKAHVALLARFRNAVGEGWAWSAEVPLPMLGDRRRWDRFLRGRDLVIGVEGETRPTDMQELQGRLALKKRDGQVDRLILVLADTEWCRRLLRLNDLDAAFPVPGKVAMRALVEGRDPGGDAVILV